MEWYSLRVISGKEQKAKENIFLEAKEYHIPELIGEVFVTIEKVVDIRNNIKRIREKVFFPGYVLIKMELTKESRHIVESTPNVISFIPAKREPIPLRDDEIKRILGEVEMKEGKEVLVIPFKAGDAVKVIDGPFIDFTGFVEEIYDDKQKVRITVSIFGRPTPVELDYFQIELE